MDDGSWCLDTGVFDLDCWNEETVEGICITLGCFSVLVDETTDICTKEQMALCLRYVDDSFCIHESFLKFITVNSLTGCNLAESIINGQ